MVKTVKMIIILGLILMLCATAVSGITGNNDGADPDDEREDDNNYKEDHPTGEGEYLVRITFIDNISGAPIPKVNIYGWSEGMPDDNRENYQKVYGETDENGIIIFHLNAGLFEFQADKDEYFPESLSLDVTGPMNHTMDLRPYPPESGIVKGYVKNEKTGEKIGDITLRFTMVESPLFPQPPLPPDVPPEDERPIEDEEWEEEKKQEGASTEPGYPGGVYFPFYIENRTLTDDSGLYSIDLIPGTYRINYYPEWDDFYPEEPREVMDGSSDSGTENRGDENSKVPEGFFPLTEKVTVEENSTVWLNVSLKPLPPKDATVKGYVRDEDGNALRDAWIHIFEDFKPREPPRPDDDGWEEEDEIIDEEREEGSSGGYEDEEYYDEMYFPGLFDDLSTYTDKNGYYEIALREGDYIMIVTPPYNYGWEEGPFMDEEGGEIEVVEMGTDDMGRGEEEKKEEETSSSETSPDDWEMDEEPYYDNNFKEHDFRFTIGPKEVIWHNVTLANPAKKDAKIVGIVKDRDTGEPVTNAEINLYGGEIFMYWSEDVDENGKFSIDVFPGYYYLSAWIIHDRYYDEEEYKEKYGEGDDTSEHEDLGGLYKVSTPYFPYSTELKIGSGETLEIEILLKPKPKDEVKIEGFVRDADSDAPLKYFPLKAMIITDEYVLHNDTYTDETGHYMIWVPLGDIILTTSLYESGKRIDIGDFDDTEDWRRGDGSSGSPGEENKDDPDNEEERMERKGYFPQKFITSADGPTTITKDFDLEERVIPDKETFSATFDGEGDAGDGYTEVYIYDTGRGVDYRGFGGWDEKGNYIEPEERTDATRGNDLDMRLPDGKYKAFAIKRSMGAITGVSDVSSFEIAGGAASNVAFSLKKAEENSGKLLIDFVSREEVKVTTTVSLGGPALMTKAIMENTVGNGDMEITGAEKKLMDRYMTITGETMIRPVLMLGGVAFVMDEGSLGYEFDSNTEGVIDNAPLKVVVGFKMTAAGKIDLAEDSSFDLNIKGPFSMDVECEVKLPKEMKLEDGSRTVKKTMTIKAGNVWKNGLSEDFDERMDGEAAEPAAEDDYSGGKNPATEMFGEEQGSDDGLKLTVFAAETAEEKKGELDDMYIYLAAAVVALIVFVVIFLVFRKKGKRPDEQIEHVDEEKV